MTRNAPASDEGTAQARADEPTPCHAARTARGRAAQAAPQSGVRLEYRFVQGDAAPQSGAEIANTLFQLLSAVAQEGSIQAAARATCRKVPSRQPPVPPPSVTATCGAA